MKPQTKKNVIRGHKLNYNAGDMAWYRHQLLILVRKMNATTKARMTELLKNNKKNTAMDASPVDIYSLLNELSLKFDNMFSDNAFPLSKKVVGKASKASKSTLESSLKKLTGGLTLKTDVLTGPLKKIVKDSIQENVDLIKSIPKKYFSQLRKNIFESITSGEGLTDLVPTIESVLPVVEDYNGQTLRRATNIAFDQTRKAYNSINAGRMQEYGALKYEWLHSGGGNKPRIYHQFTLNGQIFSFDNPPIIDEKTGERGIPSQLPNCKCTMIPVVELE